MSKDNGGPAFPQVAVNEDGFLYEPGMTLRDYFAAKALAWALADDSADYADCAKRAYQAADAMLAERAK